MVGQSNIQLVDQKIKQLESTNGSWGIAPDTGTLSGVQDMLSKTSPMLAELRSAAGWTRWGAADTTHSSMALIFGKPCIPFRSRLKLSHTISMCLYLCQYSMYISLWVVNRAVSGPDFMLCSTALRRS